MAFKFDENWQNLNNRERGAGGGEDRLDGLTDKVLQINALL